MNPHNLFISFIRAGPHALLLRMLQPVRQVLRYRLLRSGHQRPLLLLIEGFLQLLLSFFVRFRVEGLALTPCYGKGCCVGTICAFINGTLAITAVVRAYRAFPWLMAPF